jgi:hypothetical protein
MKSKFNFIFATALIFGFVFANVASAQVAQDLCKKEIRTDRVAAADCSKKAQDQGKSHGYSVACTVKDVMLGFTDPNTQLNYSLEISCTVNGFGGFAGELLVGWDSPTGIINPGWDGVAGELNYRSNPTTTGSSPDWVRTMQDSFARVRLYDPCTHQFFGDNDGVNDGNVNNVLYSVGEIRLFLADQRVAGVPSWIASIVNNAPRVSPALAQASIGGNILNNYSPTSRAVAVGPNNVPAVLLTANYTPNCSGISLTSAPTNTQTPASTPAQTSAGTRNQTGLPFTGSGTTGTYTPPVTGATGGGTTNNQTLQAYINSLLSLINSLRNQLQTISPSTGTNPTYTSISQGEGNAIATTPILLTRNLGFGDAGADVLVLTQFLVREGFLTISQSIFNQRVFDAVAKFQEAHSEEVLAPEGLTQGTGFVGPRTREVINNMLRNGGF